MLKSKIFFWYIFLRGISLYFIWIERCVENLNFICIAWGLVGCFCYSFVYFVFEVIVFSVLGREGLFKLGFNCLR